MADLGDPLNGFALAEFVDFRLAMSNVPPSGLDQRTGAIAPANTLTAWRRVLSGCFAGILDDIHGLKDNVELTFGPLCHNSSFLRAVPIGHLTSHDHVPIP